MNKKLKKLITEGLKDIFYIWKQECLSTFKDPGVLIFFFLVPLVYPLIYTLIYNPEVARNVKCVVVDESATTLSREYLRKLDATPDIDIVAYCADMQEAKIMLKKHKALGIINIPLEFSNDINRGKQTKISVYSDMRGMLNYKAIRLATTNVALEMNKHIKIKKIGYSSEQEEELSVGLLKYEEVSLFNGAKGFASFVMPAVLILIIQQTLILGIGLAAGTNREKNRSQLIIPIGNHYDGTLRNVFGRGLCFFMIYSLMSFYVLGVVPKIFNLNQIIQIGPFLLFLLPYLSACIFFAMTLSVFVKQREAVMPIFVFTSVILLFISGISWPGTSIPPFWKYVSYLFPSTFGVNAFVRMQNMGASLYEVSFEYKMLWLQTGFYFITACIVYRWQLIKMHRMIDNDSLN